MFRWVVLFVIELFSIYILFCNCIFYMDCDLSLLVSWHCTIVINDNYWRLPPLLLCSLLIPLTLEMISIRLSVAIENRILILLVITEDIENRASWVSLKSLVNL